MGRDRKPKNKLSRQEGKDLFGTGGKSLEQRLGQPPGMHGKKPGGRKTSVYAEQLREKQKVKRMYGLREEQFRRSVEKAVKSRGQTGVACSPSWNAGWTMWATGSAWRARACRRASL